MLSIGNRVSAVTSPHPEQFTAIIAPRWFRLERFACTHCGELRIAAELVRACDDLRQAWGKPVWLTSGYRCPLYNESPVVGGSRLSKHTWLLGRSGAAIEPLGGAADLHPKLGTWSAFSAWVSLIRGMTVELAGPIGGLGVYIGAKPEESWTHVDVRPVTRLAQWAELERRTISVANANGILRNRAKNERPGRVL